MTDLNPIAEAEAVQTLILVIRGKRVILDADLARLYGVSTKALNQAVRRNADRFPEDFAFELTKIEKLEVVTNCDHLGNIKYSNRLPVAYTEHGALMAASVLNSAPAVQTSVFVVRAFVRMREMLPTNIEVMHKLEKIERRVDIHESDIRQIIDAIRRLTTSEISSPRRIGFRARGGVD